MNLSIVNSILNVRRSNGNAKIPIANITQKLYDYNTQNIILKTVFNNIPREFSLPFSELVFPRLKNFDAMVLWFEENIILTTSSPAPVSTGGYIRRSETIEATWISYLGFAPVGSLETDAVWTITKQVDSADGTIISNVQYLLKKWTERGLL